MSAKSDKSFTIKPGRTDMQAFIDFMEMELEIFCAVINRRVRSFVLLLAAIVIPPIFRTAILSCMEQLPLPASGVRTVVMLMSLALMLKFSILAIQTYLKDRAAFLRF